MFQQCRKVARSRGASVTIKFSALSDKDEYLEKLSKGELLMTDLSEVSSSRNSSIGCLSDTMAITL